jgi:fatty acid desaturase
MPQVKIAGKQYDITEFAKRHPGGADVLLSYDGLDATHVFREFHGRSAIKVLNSLPCDVAHESETETERDFAILHDELEAEGRFVASPWYYTRKVSELFGLLAAASWLFRLGHWNAAAITTGLFFQQSGWLSHDFAHSQVTRRYRKVMMYLTGCLFQGFTATWWIPKHMLHHARPNAVHEHTGKPIDTDIDTAPFLYWTQRLLPASMNEYARIQGYILWLVLPFAKFAWDINSIVAAWKRKVWPEVALIGLHHALIIGLTSWRFWFVSRLWGGFFIGWVFIMSHNGMEYYERDMLGFYESQIRTTRNVSLTPLITWFTGGLNYQIEHHLFPRMPRHHLPYVASRVRQLCHKHGLCYVVENMWSCSLFLTRYLNSIAFKKVNT